MSFAPKCLCILMSKKWKLRSLTHSHASIINASCYSRLTTLLSHHVDVFIFYAYFMILLGLCLWFELLQLSINLVLSNLNNSCQLFFHRNLLRQTKINSSMCFKNGSLLVGLICWRWMENMIFRDHIPKF